MVGGMGPPRPHLTPNRPHHLIPLPHFHLRFLMAIHLGVKKIWTYLIDTHCDHIFCCRVRRWYLVYTIYLARPRRMTYRRTDHPEDLPSIKHQSGFPRPVGPSTLTRCRYSLVPPALRLSPSPVPELDSSRGRLRQRSALSQSDGNQASDELYISVSSRYLEGPRSRKAGEAQAICTCLVVTRV